MGLRASVFRVWGLRVLKFGIDSCQPGVAVRVDKLNYLLTW